ncbi:MAG: symmetrical bis(5'-nucleosyl)-tetraphosphatase [Pseudomonadota bacterium]
MAIYAIGDVQGCFQALQKLLSKINFNAQQDQLWFTGDLVSRGPQSLEVLRFVKSLGTAAQTVLGNHDLHALASFYCDSIKPHPSLQPLFAANDCAELFDWLRQQPLLFSNHAYVLVHAGILPAWDLSLAKQLAQEVAIKLQGKAHSKLLYNMYGNHPNLWQTNLIGDARYRLIINAFTRMRFCKVDGSLDLTSKKDLSAASADKIPWFLHPQRKTKKVKILFGHWAALYNNWPIAVENIYPLDSGCVWGNALTAMQLEDEKYFSVGCGA